MNCVCSESQRPIISAQIYLYTNVTMKVGVISKQVWLEIIPCWFNKFSLVNLYRDLKYYLIFWTTIVTVLYKYLIFSLSWSECKTVHIVAVSITNTTKTKFKWENDTKCVRRLGMLLWFEPGSGRYHRLTRSCGANTVGW